jgi:hypothetical protein
LFQMLLKKESEPGAFTRIKSKEIHACKIVT